MTYMYRRSTRVWLPCFLLLLLISRSNGFQLQIRRRVGKPVMVAPRSHVDQSRFSSNIFSYRRIRRMIPLRPKRSNIVPSLISFLTALLVLPKSGLALSSSSFSPLLPIDLAARIRRHSLLTVVAGLLTWSVLKAIRVQRRQSKDATSEWARYARFPGSRARAILALTCKLMPLYLLSRMLQGKRRGRLMDSSGNLLANGLLKLGPLYIKLGQIVSCRKDFLPLEWIAAIAILQDKVPAKSGQDAMDLAYSAWPTGSVGFNATFFDFNSTPLAAASLGQVHLAKLRETGEQVAIKLQRSFLKEIYDQDLAVFNKVASMVDRFGGSSGQLGGVSQSWTEIFEDAEDILYREIDYRDEAENAIRFCKDFGLTKAGGAAETAAAKSRDGKPLPSAAPWLRTPYVYGDLSSEKVLVMEFVPSIKITDTAKLDAANVTMQEREYLADSLARAYLRQFCCNLFFSTDPHPGNLGVEVLDTNERVRLVFYDFGQAASLNQNQADGILSIIEAIVDMDVERSIESFQQMGVLKDDANLDKVRAKVAENYRTGKVKANRKRLSKRGYEFKAATSSNTTTSTSNSTATKDSEVMQFFILPAEYAFVARALSQMDGVGKSLDPEFDFISSAAPWIFEIKGAGKYVREEVEKWFSNLGDKFDRIMPHYVNEEKNKNQ
jgi:predicted unusual protein kinase regulating ubiquinone biosynthesis (AarF/ABC1/UbiB family)